MVPEITKGGGGSLKAPPGPLNGKKPVLNRVKVHNVSVTSKLHNFSSRSGQHQCARSNAMLW